MIEGDNATQTELDAEEAVTLAHRNATADVHGADGAVQGALDVAELTAARILALLDDPRGAPGGARVEAARWEARP